MKHCSGLWAVESVHKPPEPFVLLLQRSSMPVIYRITYVFMMSSNIADVRAGKQFLLRSVQNKFILGGKKFLTTYSELLYERVMPPKL
jgi:hypothetical protein